MTSIEDLVHIALAHRTVAQPPAQIFMQDERSIPHTHYRNGPNETVTNPVVSRISNCDMTLCSPSSQQRDTVSSGRETPRLWNLISSPDKMRFERMKNIVVSKVRRSIDKCADGLHLPRPMTRSAARPFSSTTTPPVFTPTSNIALYAGPLNAPPHPAMEWERIQTAELFSESDELFTPAYDNSIVGATAPALGAIGCERAAKRTGHFESIRSPAQFGHIGPRESTTMRTDVSPMIDVNLSFPPFRLNEWIDEQGMATGRLSVVDDNDVVLYPRQRIVNQPWSYTDEETQQGLASRDLPSATGDGLDTLERSSEPSNRESSPVVLTHSAAESAPLDIRVSSDTIPVQISLAGEDTDEYTDNVVWPIRYFADKKDSNFLAVPRFTPHHRRIMSHSSSQSASSGLALSAYNSRILSSNSSAVLSDDSHSDMDYFSDIASDVGSAAHLGNLDGNGTVTTHDLVSSYETESFKAHMKTWLGGQHWEAESVGLDERVMG